MRTKMLDTLAYYDSTVPRIDPDIKLIWTTALRSGEYEQGQDVLKTPEGAYCCLGVYCKLAGAPESIDKRVLYNEVHDTLVEIEEIPIILFGNEGDKTYIQIPYEYGIPWEDDSVHYLLNSFTGQSVVFTYWPPVNPESFIDDQNLKMVTLPQLNDTGLTFAQIADVIDYFL